MALNQLLQQGNHWIDREEPRQAIPYFMQILQADPRHAAAITGLAKATLLLGDPVNAWQMLQMALSIAPDDPDSLNAAGCARLALGDAADARARFEAALARRPDDPGILLNLASALCSQGADSEANAVYEELERSGNATATTRYNHSLLMLTQGRMAEAWAGFEERRTALHTGLPPRNFPGRRWDGDAQPGGTLLVHAEQGLGDTIQFIRYLPWVAKKVGRVILEVPTALMGLTAAMPGVHTIVPAGDPLPDADWHVSVMSLPAVFGTTLETIPAPVPYLAADVGTVSRWSDRIGRSDGRLHVGLVWAGNPAHRRDRERSMPLSILAAACADLKGVSWHAFQVGEALAQVPEAVGKHGLDIDILFPETQPLEEVAGAIMAVDLLISVDTALAHLAGALAKPVWTLITHMPDWRWMQHRSDTPWYPTMRLFRQPRFGDWVTAVADLRAALAGLLSERR